jgi:hypothetical protein
MLWYISLASDISRGAWLEDDYEWVETFYIQATNNAGRRFNHFKGFQNREAAVKLLERVSVAKGFSPVGNKNWVETYPAYGSEHYSATGGDRVHHLDLEPELNPLLTEEQKQRVAWEHDLDTLRH